MNEPGETEPHKGSATPVADRSAPPWLPPRPAEWLALALVIGGLQLRHRAVDIAVTFGDATREGFLRATRWAEALQQAGVACVLIAGALMLYVFLTRHARGGGVLAVLFVAWLVVVLVGFVIIVTALAGSAIAR